MISPLSMDGISESRLSSVNGLLADLIRQLALNFKLQYASDTLRVIEGFRRPEEQQHLWQEGRDAAGNVINAGAIVTEARAGHSWHEFGLAVDVCPSSLVLVPGWDPTNLRWIILGQMGERLGLTWGGRWKKQDRPHFQLTGGWPVSPTEETRALYASGGLQAVWAGAGALLPLPGPFDAPTGPVTPAIVVVDARQNPQNAPLRAPPQFGQAGLDTVVTSAVVADSKTLKPKITS